MKALLAEYTVFNDPILAREGRAMLTVLHDSFDRCGYEVVTPSGGEFGEEIARLATGCDIGLVIAPDHLLPRFITTLEHSTHHIGCGSLSAAICANKRKCAGILRAHDIAVPGELATGPKVIKPLCGCGARGMLLSDREPGPEEIGQEYIEGDSFSVSLVGSRMVGNACSFYTGKPPLLLALNRQEIRIDEEGAFHYMGGETPVDHPRLGEIVDVASRAVEILGCQGYIGVDMVVGDRVYVVDVNPRPTTSIVGIAACMEEEIADILVQASMGESPDRVHLQGHVIFDKDGRVRRR